MFCQKRVELRACATYTRRQSTSTSPTTGQLEGTSLVMRCISVAGWTKVRNGAKSIQCDLHIPPGLLVRSLGDALHLPFVQSSPTDEPLLVIALARSESWRSLAAGSRHSYEPC
jgi:hypothetical protein